MKHTVSTMFALTALAGISIAAPHAAAGKATYERACKSCHGVSGVANPAVAKMMKVEMKDLKSTEVQAMSEADMKKIIAEGKGKMKPVKTVKAADAENLLAYIHTLKK